ncbi:MAG: HAD family phosphatase [Myxococcota bacterium]
MLLWRAMAAIEHVIFDLGGVLIDWNPRYLYRKLIGSEAEIERFLSEVCPPEWNALHDAGQPFAKGIADAIERHPHDAPLIRAYFDRWPEMLGGVIEDTLALLERVKARAQPVFALTNWSAETFPWALRRYPFLSDFDSILVSGEHGLAKPDPEIFELARRRFDVDPARTLFIDDSLPNVESAKRLGFQVHHFVDATQLEPVLKTLP